MPSGTPIRLERRVADAVARGEPVVVLESSVLAQGLPIPANSHAAARMTRGVERAGCVPAVAAIVRGTPTIGLTDEELARFLQRDGVAKVTARDVAWVMHRGGDGATTVAATLALMRLAGLEVFATGGIGGVHRDAPYDESADLLELARTPTVVVCAGAKSILDLPATLERLETLGVTVIGYRTSEFPGFFTAQTGLPVAQTADSAAEIAEVFRLHRSLQRPGAILVVQPPPPEVALPQDVVDAAVVAALVEARDAGIRGAAVTPWLLAAVERETRGASLDANLALLEANAELAGEIARELRLRHSDPSAGAIRTP